MFMKEISPQQLDRLSLNVVHMSMSDFILVIQPRQKHNMLAFYVSGNPQYVEFVHFIHIISTIPVLLHSD